jgi:hypothetical protein
MRSGVRSPSAPPNSLERRLRNIRRTGEISRERIISILQTLFTQFCKEKRYLSNSSENTIYFYELCFTVWKQTMGDSEVNNVSST